MGGISAQRSLTYAALVCLQVGRTPLLMAVVAAAIHDGYGEIVKTLLEHKADMEATDKV